MKTKRKNGKSANTATACSRGYCNLTFSAIILSQMAENVIQMDSTLQYLSNDIKNTKIGVRMKKLCKLQSRNNFSLLKRVNSAIKTGNCYSSPLQRGKTPAAMFRLLEYPILMGKTPATEG